MNIEIAESKGVPEVWFAKPGDGFYRRVNGREEKLSMIRAKVNPLTKATELADPDEGDILVHTVDDRWRRYSSKVASSLGLI
jgi:hypothetical protein